MFSFFKPFDVLVAQEPTGDVPAMRGRRRLTLPRTLSALDDRLLSDIGLRVDAPRAEVEPADGR